MTNYNWIISLRRIIHATNCPATNCPATNRPCNELSVRRIVRRRIVLQRIVHATNCPQRIVRDELSCNELSGHRPRPNQIGSSCNVSSTPCDMQNPCQNMGTCINNITIPRGYVCACQLGFNGTNCEFDIRSCISTTCWNNGIYILCESFYKIVYFCLF
jgi:hypothetical protein